MLAVARRRRRGGARAKKGSGSDDLSVSHRVEDVTFAGNDGLTPKHTRLRSVPWRPSRQRQTKEEHPDHESICGGIILPLSIRRTLYLSLSTHLLLDSLIQVLLFQRLAPSCVLLS